MKGKQWILALIASKDAIKPRENWVLCMNFATLLQAWKHTLYLYLVSGRPLIHQHVWDSQKAELNPRKAVEFQHHLNESQEFSGISRPSCPSPAGPATLTARISVQPRSFIIVSDVYRSLYSPSTKC